MAVCTGEVTLVDFYSGQIIESDSATVIIEGNTITYFSQHLAVNRLYNTTIIATNVANSTTTYTTISKLVRVLVVLTMY